MDTTTSKPVTIKKTVTTSEISSDIQIGTCRSYDEKRHIPSFIRQLGGTVKSRKKNTRFDLN